MREASDKQKALLARLHTASGLPKKPSDFDGMDHVKAHIRIDELIKARDSKRRKQRDYSEYFALEKQMHALGFDFVREEIVSMHTDGTKRGLRELTNTEYFDLLKYMRAKLAELEDPALKAMRRKIISRMRKMGYELEGKADMKRIYTWVKKYGKHHKALNRHTKEELISLTTQVGMMYDKHLEEVHKETAD